MKFLRTFSTRSLLLVLVAAALLVAGGTTIAIAATNAHGRVPASKPLRLALHQGLTAAQPKGVTARIRFTNNLFPSGALLGQAGATSALMSGASGRLWMRPDGHGRLELQSSAGDVQIVWKQGAATVYDASSNTVYRITLPAGQHSKQAKKNAPPSIAGIGAALAGLTKHVNVSAAKPSSVAGRPAYTLSLSPKEPGGLLGSVRLAWDGSHGVPLRAAIYPRGATKPTLELRATSIHYGSVPMSTVAIAPPAGATVVKLTPPRGQKGGKHGHAGKLPFQLVAPATLAGLKHSATHRAGHGALLVYGEGLGAITVLERPAGQNGGGSPLNALPTVSLNGVQAHELATPLATVLTWQRDGVTYVLAGSVKPSVAESAARGLQ